MSEIYECMGCGLAGELGDQFLAEEDETITCLECDGEVLLQSELRSLEAVANARFKRKPFPPLGEEDL